MLLSGNNEIKLGDLGISKLMDNTHAQTHAGTPVYMSPEMFQYFQMKTFSFIQKHIFFLIDLISIY